MSRGKCVVQSCRYRQQTTEKTAIFRCPKNEEMRRKWAALIPGIETLTTRQYVCEKHFESKFVFKSSDKQVSRLMPTAVPTIFDNDNESESQDSNSLHCNQIRKDFSNYSLENNCISSRIPNDITSDQVICEPISAKNLLTNTMQDLSYSQQPIKIEREEEEIRIKIENCEKQDEEYGQKVNSAIYDDLRINLNYYTTRLPEFWSISELSIGDRLVLVLSKECTICENEALTVLYERTIVLNKNGTIFYSIHGKKVDVQIYNEIRNIESLFDVVRKFNELKVCQGIKTFQVEIGKDSEICQDDLGYYRHTKCTIISSREQCDYCQSYNQYLSSILNDVTVF